MFSRLSSLLVLPLQPVLLVAVLLLAGGCRAASDGSGAPPPLRQLSAPPPPDPAAVPASHVALHWPVPAPPPMAIQEPVLWVALEAHLKPSHNGQATSAPPLRLRSGSGGMLTLIDAGGQRFMAPELILHWRRQPLAQALQLRRSVIGPFASFESAEETADRWRAMGVDAVIAHPREWEVWAVPGSMPPEGLTTGLVDRAETSRLELELRRADGVVELRGPIRIEASSGLQWRDGLYSGPFRLQADAYGSWTLLEEVPLERYLEGVVPHEIGARSPAAALAAQAVLARTWAVRNQHRFAVDGYHLCADTQCQVYSDPRQAGSAARTAIASTRHQVLAWRGQPIHAVYHATNGGVAAGFEEVWSGKPLAYLQAFPDGPTPYANQFSLPLTSAALTGLLADGQGAYGADHPRFRWSRTLTAEAITAALGGAAAGIGPPQDLRVLERGPSGRVLALEIKGSTGVRLLRLDAIRRTLRTLPSTLFRLTPAGPGAWRVVGGGFGHGSGLSQAGAIDLARRGWSSARILQHYYPNAELRPLSELNISPKTSTLND